MNRPLLISILTLVFASQALAYTHVENFKVISPKSRLAEASKAGLGISNLEESQKRDLERMRTRNPGRYHNTQEAPNKYVPEGEAGLEKVNPAKTLARLFILKAVENNWSHLRDSAFLQTPTENWIEAKRLMKKELDRMIFVQTTSKTHYRFEVPWASALVKKDLSQVTVTLKVAEHLDGNTPPEGADNIRISDEQ